LCECKDILVAQALNGTNITFRRWLFGDLRTDWDKIWLDACSFQLGHESDNVIWKIGKSNRFNVKSLYNALSCSEFGTYHKRIWKGKIPAKIKKFLWLISKDVVLTKEKLRKRHCLFCSLFPCFSL